MSEEIPVERADDPAAVPAAAARADGDLQRGPRLVLATLYCVFALAATSRAGVQISTAFDKAPLAYSLSMFSGLVYIAAAVGMVTRRRWSRGLAWAACSVELVGVLVIGTATVIDQAAFPDETVWSTFGSGYVFIPLVLPILGLWWLQRSRNRAAIDSP